MRDVTFPVFAGCGFLVVLELHRFSLLLYLAQQSNNDGSVGTAPDPLVWSASSLPQRRGFVQAVRDDAMLPGPDHIWWSGWVICAADVCHWPNVVGMVVKLVTFHGTLHCPAPFADLGVGALP